MNKLKLKINKRSKRTKRNNKLSRNRFLPMYSSLPQTYGFGTANIILTQFYSGIALDGEPHILNIANYALNNPRFVLYKNLYQYMKIEYIRLVFHSHNFTSSLADLYFQITYAINPDTSNIVNDNQTKIIGPVLPKPKVYTFYPPNVTFTNFQSVAYNFKEYLPTNIGVTNMPISLVYTSPIAVSYNYTCDIQFRIAFRGGNITTTTTQLIKELKELELKKDQK